MKHRSPSRDNRRLKRKRNKSGSVKYDSSSDDHLSPERIRRRRSPSSPPRYAYEKSRGRSKEDEKSYASYKVLCVSALHAKASDDVIKEALYSEYKKYGDLSIRISHDLEERVAYVCFRNAEDAREAKHSKPRVIIYDKVALVEPVYESSNRSSVDRYRDRESTRSRQRSRSYSPPYERLRKSPPTPDLYRTDRYYDRMPYPPPIPMPPRDYTRDVPIPPEFLPRPPMYPTAAAAAAVAAAAALPPPHMPLPPHLYGLPRPFLPFKPFPPQFFDKHEKRTVFPNYLHHVAPEEDPLATRTLFVGNLELTITDDELRRIFSRHGVVEDVDIKRPVPGTGNAYAFVRFRNLDMAHKAKVELSGQYIGKFQCKIGYGKATPTTKIWVGGLGPWTSIAQLEREFDRFGPIKKIDYDKPENCAYILYDSIDAAAAAIKEMRGFPLGGSDHKLRVDFADIGIRPKSMPQSSSESYDIHDPVLSAGDYRSKLNSKSMYDSLSPWNTSDYNYDRRSLYDDEPDGERKYSKSKSLNRESDRKRSSSPGNNNDDSSEKQLVIGNVIIEAKTLAEISEKAVPSWQGAWILKSSLFPADFHILGGNKNILISALPENETKLLKVTQRLRLDQPKLDDLTRRMGNINSHAVFLSLPSSSSVTVDDSSMLLKPLKNLVSYLKQKDAAGVTSLCVKDNEVACILYTFPPCDYSADILKKSARNLNNALSEDYLIVVAIKGGISG